MTKEKCNYFDFVFNLGIIIVYLHAHKYTHIGYPIHECTHTALEKDCLAHPSSLALLHTSDG